MCSLRATCQNDSMVSIPISYIRAANNVFLHDDLMISLHEIDSLRIERYEEMVICYEQKDSLRIEQL